MRTLAALLTCLLFLALSFPAEAIHTPQAVGLSWLADADDQLMNRQEAQTFTNTKLKDLRAQASRKLSLPEKAAFLYAKHQVKRQLRKNKKSATFRAPGNNEGLGLGIILGLFTGVIGIILAYVVLREDKPGVVKGVWIGFGIALLLNIILIAYILSQNTV